MFVEIRGWCLFEHVTKLCSVIAVCLVCAKSFACAAQLQYPEQNEGGRDREQRTLRNDIQRLLSDSDWPQDESFARNRTLFNTTLIGKENFTSYWHLSADAPVAEALDAAQRMHTPKSIEGKSAVVDTDRGPFLCPGTKVFASHLIHGPILIAVTGCVFIVLNSIWVFRMFFLKRSLCWSAESGGAKYLPTSTDSTDKLQPKAQFLERVADVYLTLHIHATLAVIVFFLLNMCLHTVLYGEVWNLLIEAPSTPVCKQRIVCALGTLLVDLVVSVFWSILLLSLLFLLLLNVAHRSRVLLCLCKHLSSGRRQTTCALVLHICPWFFSLTARLLHVLLLDKSLPNYLSEYAKHTALSSQENGGLGRIVQRISAEEQCARIGNSTYRLVEAILYTVPLLCVFPASAICLAAAQRRQTSGPAKQPTVLLYDTPNGLPPSIAENTKPVSSLEGTTTVHSVIQSTNCDSRNNLQGRRLAGHPNYGSIALGMLGSPQSLTVLASFCVVGLVVSGLRIMLTSLAVGAEVPDLSDLSNSQMSPDSSSRYDITEKITNLLEILTIGLVYPCFSICISTNRLLDRGVRTASMTTLNYVCEPSAGGTLTQRFPAARTRTPLTMAAGTSFVKPKSQIPAKDLLEIPTYTRCQFYGTLKTDDKNEMMFPEPGISPDSVLVSLDNCEIK
ncbi:hypothetical protein SprV_0200576900 [Sparganum proliferum]